MGNCGGVVLLAVMVTALLRVAVIIVVEAL